MELSPQLERLIETFEFLDDWTDKYRYIIDLAKKLEPLADDLRTPANKVDGCLSQVWLVARTDASEPDTLHFVADSDAQIVRGLVAILLLVFSGRSRHEIVDIDAKEFFAKLGLDQHLSVGRRNGLESMVRRVKTLAQAPVGA